MITVRSLLMAGAILPALILGACGGGGGGAPIASTPPPPPPAPLPPPPPPPPPPPTSFNTAEYRRSGGAVQAQAIAAYQAGASGQSITVGVIDSGIDLNSAEFAGRISAQSADFAGSRTLQDEGGHGTAVSGVLLGAKNDAGIHGVAFASTLLVLRTDTPGSCATSGNSGDDNGCSHSDNNIARGLDRAVIARARVVNISLGGSPANSTLRTAIDRATAAGTIIVISAGNMGVTDPAAAVNPDLLAQIANDPIARGLVIIAGATDSNQTIADFSNRAGNSANTYVTALGVRVQSNDQMGRAFLYSGTSFAAPTVSGAAALLAQAFPSLTSAQIVDLLLRTATDLGASGIDGIYGRGEINIQRAFAPQGASSLARAAVPVSLTHNATLSPAMGDAGQKGLNATIRDGYARDYAVDLSGTIDRAPRGTRLAGALGPNVRSAATSAGSATIALSVMGADARPMPLLLSGHDSEHARALAASVATRIGARTQLALGLAQSGQGLARGLAGRGAPAFLVADSGAGAGGFDRAPQGAFAVRHRLGGIALTFAAESGDVRLWQRGAVGPSGDGYRRYGYGDVSVGLDATRGPVSMAARISRMTERETLLGGRFAAALGGGGAASWFADLEIAALSGPWRVGAAVRRGWTQVSNGAVRDRSTLMTQSLSFDVVRRDLLTSGDSFAVRWSEPLRVTSGALTLTGLGTAPVALDLAPLGHERDLEGVYARPLGAGNISTNIYWRQQPGNFVAAPDELGTAIRFTLGF